MRSLFLSALYGSFFGRKVLIWSYAEFVPLGDLQRLAGDVSKDLSFALAVRLLKEVTTGLAAMHRT